MDNHSIKENIERERKALGLTQTEMAEKRGMSRTAYHKLEKGKTLLISENVGKISDVLGLSVEEVVLGYPPSRDGDGDHAGSPVSRKEIEKRREAMIADLQEQNEALECLAESLREIIQSKDETIASLRSSSDKD